jgi:proteic killer suppression protein
MGGSFRRKGLEKIYLTGATRRIGAQYVRKCVRILQSLEVAKQPEEMNIAGYRFHRLHGSPQRWSVRVTGNYRITFA